MHGLIRNFSVSECTLEPWLPPDPLERGGSAVRHRGFSRRSLPFPGTKLPLSSEWMDPIQTRPDGFQFLLATWLGSLYLAWHGYSVTVPSVCILFRTHLQHCIFECIQTSWSTWQFFFLLFCIFQTFSSLALNATQTIVNIVKMIGLWKNSRLVIFSEEDGDKHRHLDENKITE